MGGEVAIGFSPSNPPQSYWTREQATGDDQRDENEINLRRFHPICSPISLKISRAMMSRWISLVPS